jgi:Domain of unknown function (DUF4157)
LPDHSTISLQSQTVAPAAAKDVMPAQEQLGNELEIKPLQKTSIQFKLAIGTPDDPLENEADSIADTIMRMPEQNFIQRKCAHCEEEEKLQRKPLASFIQRKESSSGTVASDAVSNLINASKGNGNSMDSHTQTFMQSRFGADFSDVKLHTGGESTQMNRELNAKAFTVGNDIYFNEGQYNPNSGDGKHLLAHELTHTVQQNGQQRKDLSNCIQRKPNILNEGAEKAVEQKERFDPLLKRMTLEELWIAAIATTAGAKFLSLTKNPPALDWGSSNTRGHWAPDSNKIILNKKYKKIISDNEWKQVIVMELGNASNATLFVEIRTKASGGNVSRDDFMKAMEKGEFDARGEVIKSYLAGEFCSPADPDGCISIFPGGAMAFDVYITNDLVKEHMEIYGKDWDKDYKTKYEQLHPQGK